MKTPDSQFRTRADMAYWAILTQLLDVKRGKSLPELSSTSVEI